MFSTSGAKERKGGIFMVKKLKWLIMMLFLLMFPVSGYADTVSGQIVEIVGQRVTILDEKGKEVTLTVEQAGSLQGGHKVQVEFSQVGDALLATKVQIIQQ